MSMDAFAARKALRVVEHVEKAPKSCGASERRKWFVAIFVSVFVLLSVIMLLLIFRTFSKPTHISLDSDALSLTDHWELLHFKHEGNEKEVCSISSKKPFCSTELCSRPSIANGNWLCESSCKMKNIVKAHDNSFRILNSFRGIIQIRVSMYRIVSEKYGFVVNKNKIPIINCIFHKLHDASVNASAECLSVTSSRRYQLTTSNNRTLLKSEIHCMEKYVNFMTDDEFSVNFFGETCLCGEPWIFLQNINNSF